jgi:hypothetical protein
MNYFNRKGEGKEEDIFTFFACPRKERKEGHPG